MNNRERIGMVNERGTFGAGEEGLEDMLQPPHRASCDSTTARLGPSML